MLAVGAGARNGDPRKRSGTKMGVMAHPRKQIAIVGAGVSGLVTAHLLRDEHDVTVFEAQDRAGGHAWTIDVDLPKIGRAHV